MLVAFGGPNISKISADNYIVLFGHVLLLWEIGFVQLIHTCGTMSVSGNINHRPQPVSYTHLDVYKRQPQKRDKD